MIFEWLKLGLFLNKRFRKFAGFSGKSEGFMSNSNALVFVIFLRFFQLFSFLTTDFTDFFKNFATEITEGTEKNDI